MSQSARGFTLIELLVVISIIAVLSVVGIAVFTGVQKGARDARRRADIDSIAKAYEVQKGSVYQVLTDSQFSSGKKPQDPSKGDYFNWLSSDGSGFKICASLDNNPNDVCNTPAQNCYCKFSSQNALNPSSPADASSPQTTINAGLGGSSSSSCDPNGTLLSGLVGYWKMDENIVATTIADSSGNGNSGILLNGASIITPSHVQSFPTDLSVVFANAGNFDGIDDFISIPDSNSLDTTEFTVSAWIKMTSLYTFNGLIRKQTGGGTENYSMYINSDGSVHMPINWTNATRTNEADAPVGTLAAGTWYHVVQSYKPGQWRFYRNAEKITDIATVSKTPQTNTGSLEISMNDASRWFNGTIDDVRIYNRALSDTEISTLYNSGNGCI